MGQVRMIFSTLRRISFIRGVFTKIYILFFVGTPKLIYKKPVLLNTLKANTIV